MTQKIRDLEELNDGQLKQVTGGSLLQEPVDQNGQFGGELRAPRTGWGTWVVGKD